MGGNLSPQSPFVFLFFFSAYDLSRPPPSELRVLLYERLKQATPTDIPLVFRFLQPFKCFDFRFR